MTNLDSPRLLSRIWHLACGLLLALPAWGQQMPLRYFGQQEGLANLSVTTLAQDRPGYLWAGPENGLYRFDGHRFQQYGAAGLAVIDAEVNRQAAMIAYLNDFYLMMWLSLAAVPLVLLMRSTPRYRK